MRMTQLLLYTMRDLPADAQALNDRMLRRAGFVRKTAPGVYAFLPLGVRALRNMVRVLEQACERIGAQPLMMPALQAIELETSDDGFVLQDREQRSLGVGGPVMQNALTIARDTVRSWRALPLRLMDARLRLSDVPRPGNGLLVTREFVCLEVYAFDRDESAARDSLNELAQTLVEACRQMGLRVSVGQADGLVLFAPFDFGDEVLLQCMPCGFFALAEWCKLKEPLEPAASWEGVPECEVVSTPDLRTVEEVARFLGVPASRLVKTLLVEADGRAVAVLLRGDRELSLPKLQRVLGAEQMQMLSAEQVERLSRAPVGFAGPVGLEGVTLYADHEVRLMQDFVVGANLPDAHRIHACWGRDFAEPQWADLRIATTGDVCPRCGEALSEQRGVELGRVRQLIADDLVYDDPAGVQQHVRVTRATFGVTRALAVLVEQNHDADGMIWNPVTAPYEVIILLLNPSDEVHRQVAEKLYHELTELGIEAMLDDREERAGVKFKDADLIGIPVQVVIGRTAGEGIVEVRLRRDRTPRRLAVKDVAVAVGELLQRELETEANLSVE